MLPNPKPYQHASLYPGATRTGRYMQRFVAATADGFAVPTAATLAIRIAKVVWYPRESTSGRAGRIDEVPEHSAPASLIGQQAEGSRTLNRLSPRCRSELSVDRGDLCFHGVQGDEELLCDLVV